MVRTQVLNAFMVLLIAGSAACQDAAVRPGDSGGIPFDKARAFGFLETQVAFGPRVPGTEAHDAAREFLAGQLRNSSAHVSLQPFTGMVDGREVAMQNILCSLYPEKTERVLLCAHWDSRSRADRDPDPANHAKPVPGANDGASGVAVLLETAAAIASQEPELGVDIVFFDGEDGGDYNASETWLLGSRHFARVMPAGYRPRWAILLDMIGDRNLNLSRDYQSMNAAPALWGRLEEACAAQGVPIDAQTISVLDDHVPLIERGIPAVDLIDFDYPAWHTVGDTPDKCSPESLEKIGRIVLALVYEE